MVTLIFRDLCNADDPRKAPDAEAWGRDLEIVGDSVRLDGKIVAHRIEPHGFGDVHWERPGDAPVAFRRYTHIEVNYE